MPVSDIRSSFCRMTRCGTCMWADAKFQIARMPPDTIRSATGWAAGAGVAITPTIVCVWRTKSGRSNKGWTSLPCILCPIFSGSTSKAATICIPWVRNFSYPSSALPRLPAPPTPPPSADSSLESSRSSEAIRITRIPPSVCRRFRSFRCPFGPVWRRTPGRGQFRRRKPGTRRWSSSPAGSCNKSAGGAGSLRGCLSGCWSPEFSYRESFIEKSLSRKYSRFQGTPSLIGFQVLKVLFSLL